jgi:hypothetical protein
VGKRKAEKEVQDVYKGNGFVLRPGFIHGTRSLPLPDPIIGGIRNPIGNNIKLPLWAAGM